MKYLKQHVRLLVLTVLFAWPTLARSAAQQGVSAEHAVRLTGCRKLLQQGDQLCINSTTFLSPREAACELTEGFQHQCVAHGDCR